MRSSSPPSDRITPHGCSATWRGSPSRLSTRPKKVSSPLETDPAGPQLGQIVERGPGVARPDVRERLGDRVDLTGRQAECRTDIAYGVPYAIGVHHRDAHAPLTAEAREHRVVDLAATSGLDVDVDIRQGLPQRGQEPLHEQPVPQRLDPGHPEQVQDEAARPRAARGHPDAQRLGQVGDLGDGEEVGLVAQRADHRELVVEPGLSSAQRGPAGVAARERGLAPVAQHDRAGSAAAVDDRELGQVDRSEAEVASGVEDAVGGSGPGVVEQPAGTPALGVAGPSRQPGDLGRDGRHRRPRFEVALGVDPVDVAQVEGHEAARGVEEVGGGRTRRVGVADRVGEHRRDPHLAGEAEQPGRERAGTEARPRAAVGDHLDAEELGVDDLPPPVERGPGQVGATPRQGSADLGVGTEQDEQLTGCGMVGHERPAAHRTAALARGGGSAEMGRRHQVVERRPAGSGRRPSGDRREPTGPRQHGGAWVAQVDLGPTARRGAGGARHAQSGALQPAGRGPPRGRCRGSGRRRGRSRPWRTSRRHGRRRGR